MDYCNWAECAQKKSGNVNKEGKGTVRLEESGEVVTKIGLFCCV
jgi:hypothetical protein